MIPGLDSSVDRPDAATAAPARADGIRVWGGYLGTRGGLGLATLWSQADFDVVRKAGMTPIGFCSGWDDPAGIRDLAAAWSVLPCVDVESGIRDDGDWVQDWLARSGAGLYGNTSVHYHTGESLGRSAAFNIAAWYFLQPPACFDPQLTWPWWLPSLPMPTAWQFCGTHTEFGLSVDRGLYDDWFASAFSGSTVGGDMLTSDDINAIADAVQARLFGPAGTATYLTAITQEVVNGTPVGANGIATQLPKILAAVQTPPMVDVNALAAALAPQLPSYPPLERLAIAEAVVAAFKAQFNKP